MFNYNHHNKSIIDSQSRETLLNFTSYENMVMLRCRYNPGQEGSLLKISKSTFLCDFSCGHKSNLIFSNNVMIEPYWSKVNPYTTLCFTLIFSGLPQESKSFDLIEETPMNGAILVNNIKRNTTDVYDILIPA